MTGVMQSDRFWIRKRLGLGMKVFWPVLFLDTYLDLLHWVVDATGWQVIALLGVSSALAVFAVVPWAVRRAARKHFSKSHFAVQSAGGEGEESCVTRYGESLKLSALAALGTLGTAVVPFPEAAWWPADFLHRLAFWGSISFVVSPLLLGTCIAGFR